MFVASFTWFDLWLILHIFAVMIAFGPTFLFGAIVALGRKKPQHMAFAFEVTDFLERRVTIPVAVVVPFLGLMIVAILVLMVWRPGSCQGIC